MRGARAVAITRAMRVHAESSWSVEMVAVLLLTCGAALALGAPPPPNKLCSLNGEWSGGGCQCDPAWKGADCSYLNVGTTTIVYPEQPQVVPGASARYDAAGWGSSIMRAEDGVYHMFTDVVCQNWSPGFHELNAQLEHSSSSSPLGPWVSRGIVAGPSVDGVTSINPRIQRAPDGTYLLFHIAIQRGSMNTPTRPSNCSGARVPLNAEHRTALRLRRRSGPASSLRAAPAPAPAMAAHAQSGCGVNQTVRVLYSKSLDGPWQNVSFRGNDSRWYGPDSIPFPWDQGYNCNVNNPAGIVQVHSAHVPSPAP